jgi:hypothetical protein
VDFKLRRQPAAATPESLEAEYGLQLRAYALAASRLLGVRAVEVAIALPQTGVVCKWPYEAGAFPEIESDLVKRIGEVRAVERPVALASLAGCGECIVCRRLAAAAATRA